MTIWTIAIDWDRNGTYTDTYDEVTSRIIEAQWFLGQKKAYQEIADNSVLTLVLDNSDRRFSPDNTSSPLYDSGAGKTKVQPFRPIQITSDDGTERKHWVGWIESIKPLPNQYGKRLVTIIANGPMQFYMAAESKIRLQENKRTDEVITELIKEVVIPPALNGAWILGRVNASELNRSTWLADISAYSDLDPGIKTLNLAADNWVFNVVSPDAKKDTFDVYRAINDIAAAERGKFLFDREGRALFWNRHHLLFDADVSPDATLNNQMQDMEYNYSGLDDLKNEIIVTCHPRTVSANTTDVLWRLVDTKIQVEPNSVKEMFVKYEDGSKNRVGGRNVTLQTIEYESGTTTVTVEDKANGANLKFTNISSSQRAVIKTLVLQGQKITDEGEIEVTSKDNASIIDYGRRTLKLNLPSVSEEAEAQYIAGFEKRRRGQPRGHVTSVKFLSHSRLGGGQHSQQLARTLGNLIEVQETQTGHNAKYYIIGEQHKLFNAAEVLETTWYLEPAPGSPYAWKLGGGDSRSKLGVNTYVTY